MLFVPTAIFRSAQSTVLPNVLTIGGVPVTLGASAITIG